MYSYSRVECHKFCPYQYALKYLIHAEADRDLVAADPLLIGQAMHKALETDIDTAIAEYLNNYFIATDEVQEEIIKLEFLAKRAASLIDEDGFHEVKLETKEFLGFVDYISWTDHNTWRIWDFKYASPKYFDKYRTSAQMHVYAHYLKEIYDLEITELRYLLIPKVSIKRKAGESTALFRRRVEQELKEAHPRIVDFEYDETYVKAFFEDVKRMKDDREFKKNKTSSCRFLCDFYKHCWEGDMLPEPKRREQKQDDHIKLWIYGAPFSGKTTLANEFDMPLMLNTDGNIKYVDAPYVAIKDGYTQIGQHKKKKLAWEILKETIEELEQGSAYKTIVLDLAEDAFEHCRLYHYDKRGWEHESDDSFRAWDIIRSDFLRTMKKLTNLDYNIVLISHEDTSKDITKRTGSKVTAVRPAIQEKAANKLAGMVDIVARAVVIDDKHYISFKADEVVFGGGRLKVASEKLPLTLESVKSIYSKQDEVQGEVDEAAKPQEEKATYRRRK